MGLFQHRPEEEENQWAGLPSEPIDRDTTDTLDAAPVDPLALGLGLRTSATSVALPAPASPPPPSED